MTTNDAAFARAQAEYDAQEPPEGEYAGETLFLRAVVWLRYDPHDAQGEDEMIDAVMPPFEAEKAIAAQLGRQARPWFLEHTPDALEVVDAEYMSEAEANNYDPDREGYKRGWAAAKRVYRVGPNSEAPR